MRALEALKRAQDKGKLRHVGVTNWDHAPIERFRAAGVDIVSAQGAIFAARPAPGGYPRALGRAQTTCHLLCYGTLAGGFLTESWLRSGRSGLRLRESFTGELSSDHRRNSAPGSCSRNCWRHWRELVRNMASRSQPLASRHVLDQPQVAAVICGRALCPPISTRPCRFFRFSLDDAESRGDRSRAGARRVGRTGQSTGSRAIVRDGTGGS